MFIDYVSVFPGILLSSRYESWFVAILYVLEIGSFACYR